MQTVVELKVFQRKAAKLFTDDERKDLIDYISANPFSGDEIPGTGGIRKLRFRAKGQGKRGGARLIYFAFDSINPIYLITCYPKDKKINLTPDEKKQVAAFSTLVKAELRKKNR